MLERPMLERPMLECPHRMLSGRVVDLIHPQADQFAIEDLALSLSRENRWNGQTKGEHGLSVAEHSVTVMWLVLLRLDGAENKLEAALEALAHDAPEGIVRDLAAPFKRELERAGNHSYKDLESRFDRPIRQALGLRETPRPAIAHAVKTADQISALHEAVLLAGWPVDEAVERIGGGVLKFEPRLAHFFGAPLSPSLARKLWLQHVRERLEKFAVCR